MNADGLIILPPNYQAIGSFDIHGHAVMRRDEKVGLINKEGDEIIPPLFEDLKTLDAQLCAVRKDEKWLVVNFEGKVLIDRAYEQVEVWDSEYIGYRSNGLWGITHLTGEEICLPNYELITYFGEGHFLLHQALSRLEVCYTLWCRDQS